MQLAECYALGLGGGDEPPYAAPFMAAPEEAEDGGADILLGGADSDLIEGRAGDDLIDGDAWLDAYLVGPGGEKSDTMATFQDRVFAGDLSPADIRIVREIRTATGQGNVVDTAVFSGARSDYFLSRGAGQVILVTDLNPGDGDDGTDHVSSVEYLEFGDQTVDLLFAPPNLPRFDGLQYLASNADLIAAFGADVGAAVRHYATVGAAEGRALDSFDEAQYLANYEDLRAAFGTDLEAATW